jgi:thiamine-phosphate pyrophosphorylase
MPAPLLYYITDRTAFSADERTRRIRLLDKISEAAAAGIDYIQLREKDLPAHDLEALAKEAIEIIRNTIPPTEHCPLNTALLINSRTDVAQAVGAEGVHLPANDLSPLEAKAIWKKCGAGTPAREISPLNPLTSVSCHSPEEVVQAASNGATLALFAPVFKKKDAPGIPATGLALLHKACQANIPVIALGGVTLQNAAPCLQTGAAGIAAIRLFQENNIAEVVRTLRNL